MKKYRIRKNRRRKITFWLLAGAAAAVLLIAFLSGTVYYRDHFLKSSEINGIEIGGLTLEEAEARVENANRAYVLTVTGTDGRTEQILGSGIGLHYTEDNEIAGLLSEQNRFTWFSGIGTKKAYALSTNTVYDDALLSEAMDKLASLNTASQTAPADAYITTDSEGKYVIVPERAGTLIDVSAAREKISEAVREGETAVDLSSCLVQPKITQADPGLISRRDARNTFMAASGLTYTFGSKKETISGGTLAGLLTDDGTTVSLDENAVRTLVNSWAKAYDTFGLSMNFTTHSGQTVTVPAGGDYGWALDIDATADDVISAIRSGTGGSRDAVFEYSAMSWENGGLGGTYVEVSTEEQKLWLYKDGEMILSTDIVTGLPTEDRTTYKGVFAVDAKEEHATLGTYDVQGYESPVNYWAPFNGGEGLHDAPWRMAFGGNIYQTDGSHGCVNIPEENMSLIYHTISIGTPVVVY